MAASDLANLFGLNNKQESMDTARITSFEPGTFKPIMAGPEVAQGVAAGLFNMGNAVFGAFDNKVKETSRDATAQATDDFLNTLQIAANTASPDELPLVVATFSDVLNNNPAILQDKARAALNEISARHSKTMQSLIDADTKLKEAALKVNEGKSVDMAKNLSAARETWTAAQGEITKFAENNSGAIKDYLITSILEDSSTLKSFDPEDIRSLVQTKLTELQSTVGFPMTMELQNKVLEGVYSAIFNNENYALIADSQEYKIRSDRHNADQRQLINQAVPEALMSGLAGTKFTTPQQDLLRDTIGAFFVNNWHNISKARAEWLDTNLKDLRYRLDKVGITDRDLQLAILNLAIGGIDITDKEAVGEYVDKLNKVLVNADKTDYNEKTLLTHLFTSSEDEDQPEAKVVNDLTDVIRKTYEGRGHSSKMVEQAKIAGDFLGALLYSDTYRSSVNPKLEQLSRDLKIQDREFEKYKANSILTYMKGNRTGEQLRTSKLSTYNVLSGRYNSLANQQRASERTMDWLLGNDNAIAISDITTSTIPMSFEEKQAYTSNIDKTLGTSTDKAGKRIKVTYEPTKFNALAQSFEPLKGLVNSIQQMLPQGVTVDDLVIAEGFVAGTYKDGGNVAIGYGNNIKGNTALIKKIEQYEQAGDLAGLLNDADFRKAIYNSVHGELVKMRKDFPEDPFNYYFKRSTQLFKDQFNQMSKEDQNLVRHNINAAVFLAYYRGEGKAIKRAIDRSIGKDQNSFDLAAFRYAMGDFMSRDANIDLRGRYGRFLKFK